MTVTMRVVENCEGCGIGILGTRNHTGWVFPLDPNRTILTREPKMKTFCLACTTLLRLRMHPLFLEERTQ